MSSTIACRKSRKVRRCTNCNVPGSIQPGDRYLMITIFPGHDVSPVDRPYQYPECAGCATSSGRGEILNPVLEGQTVIDDVLEGGEHGMHETAVPVRS